VQPGEGTGAAVKTRQRAIKRALRQHRVGRSIRGSPWVVHGLAGSTSSADRLKVTSQRACSGCLLPPGLAPWCDESCFPLL